MKKIVILGCENSHADTFLRLMRQDARWKDTEVAGVYSDEPSAVAALCEKYGVRPMTHYAELAGQVDGAMVTARHGGNHYRYAEAYLKSGAALFLDKPITISEEEAVRFAREFRQYKTKVTGGSTCKFEDTVLRLKADAAGEKGGKTVGGFVRCPLISQSVYGGYFFYAQHLVEIVSEIFGAYPDRVSACENSGKITVIFRYGDYDVTGLYVDGSQDYYALRAFQEGTDGGALTIDDVCFGRELESFRRILYGGEQEISYARLIAPVFVMNAIVRSLSSGREERVRREE